jgi:hypothetical protein
MGIRDDGIPPSFVRMLQTHSPALKLESVEVQQAIAYLVWVSPTYSRAHKELEGHMSITYQELDGHFGRRGFKALNDRLGIFDVTPNWWSDQGLTKGYKLKRDLEAAVGKYLTGWRRRMTKASRVLVGMDGKQVHHIPQAVASKDMKGITAKAWNRAKVKKLVPVDLPRLTHYYKTLERMLDDPQKDLFFAGDIASAQYKLDVIGRLMGMSREHEGQCCVVQRYIESDSGRLYGKNINLATVPRSVKEVALHGMWEYDFANCHYSILYQMAQQHGIECKAVAYYLDNKDMVRKQLMADIGISKDDAKTCLIALIYGARFSHRHEDAIPAAVGKDAALMLYKHDLFVALKDDVTKARLLILEKWPRSRRSLQNLYGKWISEKAGDRQILAHLLQGVEAKMLEAIRKQYPDELMLLQHDGFASLVQLNVELMTKAIYEATGYQMMIEVKRISLSPDMGIPKR